MIKIFNNACLEALQLPFSLILWIEKNRIKINENTTICAVIENGLLFCLSFPLHGYQADDYEAFTQRHLFCYQWWAFCFYRSDWIWLCCIFSAYNYNYRLHLHTTQTNHSFGDDPEYLMFENFVCKYKYLLANLVNLVNFPDFVPVIYTF